MASDSPSKGDLATQREAAQQDGFLREVDEALREQEFFDTLKRYGRPVGAAIMLGLAALGGYLWWDSSAKQTAGALSERAIVALDKLDAGSPDAAAKDLAPLAKEGSEGARGSTALTLAALALEQGRADEAAKRFAAIAADPAMPQPFRDMATIREVSIRFDTMKSDEVVARLKPLAVPGKAWFGSAGELLGLAYLAQNKTDLAGALYAQIAKDKSVPDSLRARARQIAGGLGYDGGTDLPTAQPVAAQ